MPDAKTGPKINRRTSRKQNWEKRWSNPDFAPFWLRNDNDPAIESDLISGWFKPDSRIIDIGCGRGEIAFALAKAGMNVLGVDVAKPAIQLARKRYISEELRLNFRTGDITSEDMTDFGRFDYLVDRGCLHSIPRELHAQYLNNLISLSRKKAGMILLHKIEEQGQKALKKDLRELFNEHFRRVSIEKIWFDPKAKSKPGLKIKLEKTSA